MTIAEEMSMWLEAIFSEQDLQQVLMQFAPVTIALGDTGGELFLDTPSEVDLVEGKGLRVRCDCTIHYPVLGFDLPLKIKGVQVMIEPQIERSDEGEEKLLFRVQLEKADFPILPSLVDAKVVDVINVELDKRKVDMAWNFSKTLANAIPLPALFAPRETLVLGVHGGQVKTSDTLLGLAISMHADMRRGDGPALDAALDKAPKKDERPEYANGKNVPAVTPRPRQNILPLVGAVAAALLVTSVVGFALGHAFAPRPRLF